MAAIDVSAARKADGKGAVASLSYTRGDALWAPVL